MFSAAAKRKKRAACFHAALCDRTFTKDYFPGVVDEPEEDDPGVVELLLELEPEVEFTLLSLLFLSFLDFLSFLLVLVELALWSLEVLEVEFVVSFGELTPGLVELLGVELGACASANGLRLTERAGTSKKASLFFMLLAPFERRCSYGIYRSRCFATVSKLPGNVREMES
jgi:hypothetical protein